MPTAAPPATRPLKISIIIPGWNEAKNVTSCLTSLKQQTYDNFNVFFVLGGENPAYVDRIRNDSWNRLTILDQQIPNKMRACNSVLHLSELGDVLLFSDMDCEFPKNLLRRYAEAFLDSNKNILTGRVRPISRSRHFVDRYHRCFEETISPKAPKVTTGLMGANFAVRKTFFMERIGMFDESVKVGTDHAIARQFRKIGEPIHFDPNLVVDTQMFTAGIAKYIDQQTRWIKIRIIRNRGRNPKAFRSGIASLAFAWATAIFLPLSLLVTENYRHAAATSLWWTLAVLWGGGLAKAWGERLKILRRRECAESRHHITIDMAAAMALVGIHLSLRIVASVQLIVSRGKC